MNLDSIIFELAIIFIGASILATVFLYFKQPIILAYIALGMIIGPWGFKIINNHSHIEKLSHFGIILLLFLIGLNLQPIKFIQLFRKTSILAITTCFIFASSISLSVLSFGFSVVESLICGLALMFSSTVISLKLVPTTTLHLKHKGKVMTSILLFQDIIAIIIIILLNGSKEGVSYIQIPILLGKLIFLTTAVFLMVKFTIFPLFRKFDIIQEYIFLVSLGWCLVVAEIAHLIGLSYEIGAFIAGVSIASSIIALVIAEKLKPLRDFFLILFFFSIGANFDYLVSTNVLLPGIIIAIIILVIKPIVFKIGLEKTGEPKKESKEMGFRLGQASEFSLLLASAATTAGVISEKASCLIQLVTIITFIVSTHIVVNKFNTPISRSKKKKIK